MKYIKTLLFATIISTLLFTTSCGGDDDSPSDADRATSQLVGTWIATGVILDNISVLSPTYDNFQLIVNSDLSYDTNGGAPAFTDNGGFFTLGEVMGDIINVTMDGVAATFTVDTETNTALLEFTAPSDPIGARVSGLNGDYQFSLQKQ
ncbi:MAG: hypothetical protein AAF789_05245 [Bacteroidota bacterium]